MKKAMMPLAGCLFAALLLGAMGCPASNQPMQPNGTMMQKK
jgi:hypothetical protein